MPSKTVKACVAVAAQVKKKAFNNSSFFKATLKMNNKALALEVNVLKKKNKKLGMINMLLLKENQALQFTLATSRHKERKLMIILKDLQSLYSPDDDPPASEECYRQPFNTDNIQMQRGKRTGRSTPKPSLPKNDSRRSTSNSVECHGGPTNSIGIESNTDESPSLDHPSSMAMAAAEQEMEMTASEQSAVKKKRRYIIQKTQVGEKAVPVHVAVQPEACPESDNTGESPSLGHLRCSLAEQENMLLDTDMEITQSVNTEIIVVAEQSACPESGSTGDKSPSLSSAHALDHPSSMAMAAENSVLPDTEMTASDTQIVVVTGEGTLKKGPTMKEKTTMGNKGRVPLGREDNMASDKGPLRPRRTCSAIVDYKDPPINRKMRRGDKGSDMEFLSSPVFKSLKKRPKSSHRKTEDQLATPKMSGLGDASLLHLRT